MAALTHVYEDRWGEVIDHADAGYVEIRWYDATESMTEDAFERWLLEFTKAVDRARRPGILVDATRFLMDRSNARMSWWETTIVPRYNAAGVRKFAFLMGGDMPEIGKAPVVTPPAAFATGYFGRRENAVAWLRET